MHQFRKILAGIDLSSGGSLIGDTLTAPNQEVVRQALALAAGSGAELCFFTVLDVPDTIQRLIDEQRGNASNVFDEAYEVLQQLKDEAAAVNVKADAVVGLGSSWQRLIERVKEHEHDLLIVGTRNPGTLDRILYGSTAMKVLRYCPCPVWVTKPHEDDGRTVVLVAHDLTDVGQRALEVAADIAALHQGSLLVFHSVEIASHYGTVTPLVSDEESAKRLKSAEDAVADSLSRLDAVPASCELLIREGQPDIQLLTVLQERNVDLVVMGTRARTGFGGLVTGNTAERVLPELNCSVLAIKPDDYKCPI